MPPINWPSEKIREEWEAARASRLAGETPAPAEEDPDPVDDTPSPSSAGKGKRPPKS